MEQQGKIIKTSQELRMVYWQQYTFSQNQTRQFFCNAILFKNQGTGDVIINDVYTIQPGDADSFNCDQNEIDASVYKISFAPGATTNKLAISVKINQGTTIALYNYQMSLVSPGDRRTQVKNYYKRRKRGLF